MSVSASLPDLGAAAQAAANAGNGLQQFLGRTTDLAGGGPGSPLAGVLHTLGELPATLDIDVRALTDRLPQALDTLRHAVPDDALRQLDALQGAYAGLQAFLADSPLVRQIGSGQGLEAAALAVLQQVLQAFEDRLAALAAGLIDTATLQQVREALTLLQALAGGQVPAPGELLPLLAQHVVGVAPDLLQAARGQLAAMLQQLAGPFGDAALQAALGAPRQALANAYADLARALRDFDADDPAAYAALQPLIQAWSDAQAVAFDALAASLDALTAVVAAPQWDTLFSAHATALSAIPLPDVPTVADAVAAMAALIEGLVQRLGMVLSPQDLAAQIQGLSAALEATLAQSGLAQVQQLLIDFIGRIQAQVEQVPTEVVRDAVHGMLMRVRQELDALGITQAREQIAQGFASAQSFVDQRLGGELATAVSQALDGALQQFNAIPVAELGQTLADGIAQAGTLVQQLAGELQGALDELRDLLSRLDGVDFKPLADEVVGEIDALTAKLAAIKPESLGEPEKLALQGGLALLRGIDLTGTVNRQLKQGYAQIDAELTQAVQAVLDAWNRLRGQLLGFDGAQLLGPLEALLGQVTQAVNRLNGGVVTQPLQDLADQALRQAAALSPAALLQPLQAPYQQVLATLDRVNPSVWVQPLRALHAEIDRLVAMVDITPLLDLLEARERQLFASARNGLLQALDALSLPPPLDSFLDTMKALVMGLADAVFGDPDEALAQFNLQLQGAVRPSTLFQPLDAAFDQLMAALQALPPDEVLAALEALRSGLGAALPALDPRQVRQALLDARAGLDQLSPAALAGVVALPALQAGWSLRVAAGNVPDALKIDLRARLDLALAPVQPDQPGARLQQLQQRQQALVQALGARLQGLDASGAQAAWQRLDTGLRRLLPAFLTQPRPLTAADLTVGLAAMRPSHQARRIDDAVAGFLARLQPLQPAIDEAVNGFYGAVRQQARALHPGALKGAVAGVYDALRERLHVLDPDALQADLDAAIWQPLQAPLRAIDPAAIGAQLDALYQHLLQTLGTALRGLVGQIAAAVDAFLAQVRAALAQVLGALKQQLQAILDAVLAIVRQVDGLVVHDLLERLLSLLDNLQASFDRELDRVANEFDEMLAAIPLGGGAGGRQALAV